MPKIGTIITTILCLCILSLGIIFVLTLIDLFLGTTISPFNLSTNLL